MSKYQLGTSVLFISIVVLIAFVAWYVNDQDDSQQQVTFNRDIAPIIFTHCVSCHRPSESAPFSLLTYKDVAERAEQIVEVTQSGYMPPWLPKHGYGDFEGSRGLSSTQMECIKRWVELGLPEGSHNDLPPKPEFVTGWQLGEPDLILQMPQSYTLPPDGADVFRNFVLPIPVASSHFVRAVELRPGNKQIVHHANMLVDQTGAARRLDQQDTEPGYGGMENLSVASRPAGHFLSWKVGTVPFAGYKKKAWQVDPGTDLVINMHMLPSGKPEPLQAKVGLYFSQTRPTDPSLALIQLEADHKLDILPGDKSFTVTDEFLLPVDVDVLGIYPHAHLLGRDLQGYALLPDGRKEWLIWIDDWDWNWQAVYRYQKPISLPKGTLLVMRYTYDNSSDNPLNPHYPPKRVIAGNRTEDEMAHLWVQVLPENNFDLQVLNESKARHQLTKYPNKEDQRITLGKSLAGQGRYTAAIEEFRKVIASQPKNIAARYNLACVLNLDGHASASKKEFKEVLQLEPGHVETHNNLGILFFREGDNQAAVKHYRAAIEKRPGFAIGHNNLGLALQKLGQLDEAENHYRRALQLRPDFKSAAQRLKQLQDLDPATRP